MLTSSLRTTVTLWCLIYARLNLLVQEKTLDHSSDNSNDTEQKESLLKGDLQLCRGFSARRIYFRVSSILLQCYPVGKPVPILGNPFINPLVKKTSLELSSSFVKLCFSTVEREIKSFNLSQEHWPHFPFLPLLLCFFLLSFFCISSNGK